MEPAQELEQGKIPTPDGTHLCVYRLGSGERTIIVPNAVYLLEHFAHLNRDFTLIAYDLRNRGRSDPIRDRQLVHRGVHHDVDDLETVRAYFNVDAVSLIGHSYLGLMVILYAIAHPARIERIVQIGAVGPDPQREYPPHLMADDLVTLATSDKAVRLQTLRDEGIDESEPRRFCEAWWEFMRDVLVANPEHRARLGDHFCEFENEWPINMERHLSDNIHPSLRRLRLRDSDLAAVDAAVLTVHGTRDRNAPYGGGREWAARLPDARLLRVEGAAHMPFVEAPGLVMPAIAEFLAGTWPAAAEQIVGLDDV